MFLITFSIKTIFDNSEIGNAKIPILYENVLNSEYCQLNQKGENNQPPPPGWEHIPPLQRHREFLSSLSILECLRMRGGL